MDWEEFKKLADEWDEDTCVMSFIVTSHPTYRRIMAEGKAVIPFMLKDLKENNRHWFQGLRALSGECPVEMKYAGNFAIMKRIWLKWGVEKGYLPVEDAPSKVSWFKKLLGYR